MIIYDVVNIFSMKNYTSSRKLRVGLNWYPGVNWSTTTRLGMYVFSSYVYLNFGDNWYPAIIGSKAVMNSDINNCPRWTFFFRYDNINRQ